MRKGRIINWLPLLQHLNRCRMALIKWSGLRALVIQKQVSIVFTIRDAWLKIKKKALRWVTKVPKCTIINEFIACVSIENSISFSSVNIGPIFSYFKMQTKFVSGTFPTIIKIKKGTPLKYWISWDKLMYAWNNHFLSFICLKYVQK